MMNYLWGGMILAGIIYGAFTGTMQEVTDAAISSSKEAVMLCVTMVGIMSLWTGVMEIGSEAGMIHGRLSGFCFRIYQMAMKQINILQRTL